jgi:hypothetical protein
VNVYTVGEKKEQPNLVGERYHTPYENYAMQSYGDIVFQKSTSKNMDKLWRHFHTKQNYPKFYLGMAKKTAICKCPDTGEEEWYNGDRNLSVADPKKGESVTVTLTVNTGTYSKDFVFMGWVKQPVHEWKMESGSVLQLDLRFVDGLLPEDKKYLRMNG